MARPPAPRAPDSLPYPLPSFQDLEEEYGSMPIPAHGLSPSILLDRSNRRRRPRRMLPEDVAWRREARRRWLGLEGERRMGKRDYGNGGAEGIVLSLGLSQDYPYDAVYTVDAKVGGQWFPLQVDTGSADLWLASTSCSSSACSGASLYSSSSSPSIPTNRTFSIQYLQGRVSGPIVWDDVSIGSYNIPSQAFASADSVSSERLSYDAFSGVLGLAPALDSKIAQLIPPVVGNDPDGASWLSNLYGSDTPPPPFFSLLLERPEDPYTVSVLGLGAHPLRDTPSSFAPSSLDWTPVVTSTDGALFWRLPITALTLQVAGHTATLQLGKSIAVPTSARPVGVIDSGTPLILVAPAVADAFWGAVGVSPSADGNFYPLCTLMVNATITIGSVDYPLHPLDLSIPAANDPTSVNCVGGVQSVTGQSAGDIILGAAFLKNVYSVYTSNTSVYNPTSTLYPLPNPLPSDEQDLPHVGLYPLTNATLAAAAFDTVRIQNQAITPTTTPAPGNGGGGQLNIPSVNTSSNLKVPLPVVIILAVVGFIALVVSLYLLRGCLYRRRREREQLAAEAGRAAGGADESFTFANGKAVPDSGFDDALLFLGAGRKKSLRSMSDGSGGTEGTGRSGSSREREAGRERSREGEREREGGRATDGADEPTPPTVPVTAHDRSPSLARELADQPWLGYGLALGSAGGGGRYPSATSPVRTSRVEIPMPVRRESAPLPSFSSTGGGGGGGRGPLDAQEERERERFRSNLRRGLSNLSIPFSFSGGVGGRRSSGGGAVGIGMMPLSSEPLPLSPAAGAAAGVGGPGGIPGGMGRRGSEETIELPIIRERGKGSDLGHPLPPIPPDHQPEQDQEREREHEPEPTEEGLTSAGPLLGTFSAANEDERTSDVDHAV